MAERPLFSDALITLSASANGNAGGTTVVASTAGQVNNFYQGMTIRIVASSTGSIVNEEREVILYASGTGTFTVDPPFTAQVPSGTVFDIVNDRPGAGADAGALISVLGTASAAGTTLTLIDTVLLTQADNYWNGLMLIMLSGNNAGLVRKIRLFANATSTLTVDPAFPNATANGDGYAIFAISDNVPTTDGTFNILSSQVLGSKADAAVFAASATASGIAYLKGLFGSVTLTKATLAASNFFAGEVNVISLTPAAVSELGGVSVSIAGFTAGAVITFRIYKMTNGVEDLIQSFTRIAGTDPNGVMIIDSPDIIDGNGALNSWRLTLQSNNAGDAARTPRYQYTLKRIAA